MSTYYKGLSPDILEKGELFPKPA